MKDLKKILFCIILAANFLSADEEKLNVIDVNDAWQKYPSSSIQSKDAKDLALPDLSTAKKLHERILEHIKTERLAQIKSTIEAMISSNENNDAIRIKAGVIYAQNYFYTEALAEFDIAFRLNPENSKALNNAANVYYITGKYEKAAEYYSRSLQINKNDPLVLLNLSFLYYELGKFDQARECYYKAILIDPSLNKPEYEVIACNNVSDGTAKAANKGTSKIHPGWAR